MFRLALLLSCLTCWSESLCCQTVSFLEAVTSSLRAGSRYSETCVGISRLQTIVADFNGDGLPDIAIRYFETQYSKIMNARAAVFLNSSPDDGFTVTGVGAAAGISPVARGAIVSAYGVNLPPRRELAVDPLNPATSLGGIQVHIKRGMPPAFRPGLVWNAWGAFQSKISPNSS